MHMPRRGGRHQVLVKGAERAMEAFKMEIARDLGLESKIDNNTFKGLTTEEVGFIGGEMVRRIQAAGEYAIMQRHSNGETRLMPPEALPSKSQVREMSNNGNVLETVPDTSNSSNVSQTPKVERPKSPKESSTSPNTPS